MAKSSEDYEIMAKYNQPNFTYYLEEEDKIDFEVTELEDGNYSLHDCNTGITTIHSSYEEAIDARPRQYS